MIEVVIAIFITAVAIMAVFSLVAPSWQNVAKSDLLGRASGILYEQLIRQEAKLMNPCCVVTTGGLPPMVVNTSGETTSQPGDAQFNVTTTITNLATNVWRVTVRVAWTGHTGITESLIVNRQDGFLYPSGCVLGGTVCQ